MHNTRSRSPGESRKHNKIYDGKAKKIDEDKFYSITEIKSQLENVNISVEAEPDQCKFFFNEKKQKITLEALLK